MSKAKNQIENPAFGAAVKVVVIGRPNVGKSTLFNRLVGHRRALVHDEPGVTRDRLEVSTTWWVKAKPYPVRVVDTGGLGGERFADEIKKQVDIALSEADLVLMVFDGQAGLTDHDEQLIRELQRSGVQKRIPIVGVVNKVDAEQHEERINEFFASGLDPLLTVSAEHGRGIEDLEEVVARTLGFDPDSAAHATGAELKEIEAAQALLQEEAEADAEAEAEALALGEEGANALTTPVDEAPELTLEAEEEAESLDEVPDEEEPRERRAPRVAILGRPNVGKSTLVNALLGKERMITSPIAGTTVDSIDSVVDLGGKPFVFVDTAGIRKKSKTEQGIEVLSVVQSRKALESADIAILLLDGESGITDQDEKIGGLIQAAGISVILVLNKWDTQRSNEEFTRDVASEVVRKKMGFLQYAPIMFISAKEGRGLKDLGELIDDILKQRRVKIPTHEFTVWVRKEATIHNPMNAKFFLAHQTGRHPPTFVVHVNDPKRVHFSLRRHFINAMRERWGFMGSPIRMLFVEGKSSRKRPRSNY
jgi:GTP-binding protein